MLQEAGGWWWLVVAPCYNAAAAVTLSDTSPAPDTAASPQQIPTQLKLCGAS